MIVLAYGVPGAGKTLLLHDLIRAQAQAQRFFVMAHSLEWHPEAAHWRGAPPEGLRVLQGRDAVQRLRWEPLPEVGVFVCINVEASEVVQLVVDQGSSVYVDDELDLLARRKGWEASPLRQIVHQGRHLANAQGEYTECHIMGACRRPQNLHTDLTDLADQFYVFRLKGGNTRTRLLADALLEDDAEWDTLRELPNFHCKWVEAGREEWKSIPPLEPPKEAPSP